MRELGAAIDYRFSDETLLEAALTHRSAGQPNNERLEFLGDAVLGMVIAELLCQRHPRLSEGDLSRLRSTLVRGATLAGVARDIDLGACLRLGPGERKSGGYRRDSILADALEALIGAVYLDGGIAPAAAVIRRLWGARLDDLPDAGELKDPKTRLQEHLQALGRPLPEYHLEHVSGDDHRQSFRVACSIDGAGRWFGEGSSRRRAEQAAASAALEELLADA